MPRDWVLHIDGDAFFASCEVVRKPELWGKAVVVGQERGIVTALTYPAKKIGIKRGDPIFKIKQDFPTVPILSSHFELYNFYSKNLAKILLEHTDKFETYSIDECFAIINCKENEVYEKVLNLKRIVQSKLGVTYSFGVSINKTLAKVASKKNKPDGLCLLLNKEEIDKALKDTKVGDIWGIGAKTAEKINNIKIFDAYTYSICNGQGVLKSEFCKPTAETQRELSGEIIFKVGSENPHQKSLQSTRSFIKKSSVKKFIFSELSRNVEVACGELRSKKLYTKHFSFFITRAKGSEFKTLGESFEMPFYTQSSTQLLKFIEQTFDKFERTLPGLYKKTGVHLLGLEKADNIPDDLFGDNAKHLNEENKLSQVLENIRHKHGFESLSLVSSSESLRVRGVDKERRDRMDDYIYGLPLPFLGIISEQV